MSIGGSQTNCAAEVREHPGDNGRLAVAFRNPVLAEPVRRYGHPDPYESCDGGRKGLVSREVGFPSQRGDLAFELRAMAEA